MKNDAGQAERSAAWVCMYGMVQTVYYGRVYILITPVVLVSTIPHQYIRSPDLWLSRRFFLVPHPLYHIHIHFHFHFFHLPTLTLTTHGHIVYPLHPSHSPHFSEIWEGTGPDRHIIHGLHEKIHSPRPWIQATSGIYRALRPKCTAKVEVTTPLSSGQLFLSTSTHPKPSRTPGMFLQPTVDAKGQSQGQSIPEVGAVSSVHIGLPITVYPS